MNTLRRLQDWFSPLVRSDARGASAPFALPPSAQENRAEPAFDLDVAPGTKIVEVRARGAAGKPAGASHWLLRNILFVAMLVMTLAGVMLKLPVLYWIAMTPVFGLISFVAGWSHFHKRGERVGLAYRLAAIWFALLACAYSLYSGGLQGVLDLDVSSSPAMMTLLALGTFVAGVQARVWQICGVGAALLVAGPAVAWLDQSPLAAAAAACALIALGGAFWWIKRGGISGRASPPA